MIVKSLFPSAKFTINKAADGCIYRDAHGNSFRFDGNELVCDKYRIGGFMPFSSSGYAQMRIPATDDMQVKITDSNQVTDQTVLM